MSDVYTAKYAAKLMLFHTIFILLGVGFFVAGFKLSEGSDGDGGPYFITGMILAGVNLFNLLLEFLIFLYLVTRKRFLYSPAKKCHTVKIFTIIIAYAYGAVGIGVTASLGFCASDDEEEAKCYYTKNEKENKGVAGGLMGLHLLFLVCTIWKVQLAKNKNFYMVSDSSAIDTRKRLEESMQRAEKLKILSKKESPRKKDEFKLASDSDSSDSSSQSSKPSKSRAVLKPLPRKSKLSKAALATVFVSSVQKPLRKVHKDGDTQKRNTINRRSTDPNMQRRVVSPPPPYDEDNIKLSPRKLKKMESRMSDVADKRIKRSRRPSDLSVKSRGVPPPSYDEAAYMPRDPPRVGLVSRPSVPYWVPPPPEKDEDCGAPDNIYTGSAFPDSHPEVYFAEPVRHQDSFMRQ